MVQSSFIFQDGQRLSVTVSMGCTFAEQDDSIDGIVLRADRLMYRSKGAGRNCVSMG
jgi:PleD family two-component response regulator